MNAIFTLDSAKISRLCLFALLATIALVASRFWRWRKLKLESAFHLAALLSLIAIPVTFALVNIPATVKAEQPGFPVHYHLVQTKVAANPAEDNDKTDDAQNDSHRTITIRVVDSEGNAIKGARVFRNHVYQPDDEERLKIENETYTTDMGGAAEVELSGATIDLRIWVSAKGYTQLHAMWAEKLQSDGGKIPDEFTFTMHNSTSIGGIIVDDSGNPIPGVKVEVNDAACKPDYAARPDLPGKRPLRSYSLTNADGVKTDENGRWSIANVPSDEQLGDDENIPDKILLRITHPDYLGDDEQINAELTDETRWGGIQRSQEIKLASLRDKSAKIVLKPRPQTAGEANFGIRWPGEWISTVTVDTHFVNEPMVEEISSDAATKLFTDDGKLNADWAATINWTDVPDHDSWKKEQNEKLAAMALEPRDNAASVQIVRFSKTQVEIKVVRNIANYLWHHYFAVAKHFRIERSETVDAKFDLDQLEARYLLTYKGIGVGTSLRAARERLGEPDYTQQTQAVGWYTDYYFKDDVAVFYQNMAVHDITREVPDQVKEAAAEARRAIETHRDDADE